MKKKIIIGVVLVITLFLLGLVGYLFSQEMESGDQATSQKQEMESFFGNSSLPEARNLSFTKQELPQKHTFEKSQMSPLVGSALVDIDQNGIDEILVGGAHNQNDVWYEYQNGKMVNITQRLQWQKGEGATYGTAVVDYDQDGDGDVFVARADGVYYYENKSGATFAAGKRIEVFLEEGSVPTGITLGDLNADGNVDMFVSTYLRHDRIEGTTIFNKEAHGTVSRLLLGKGDLIFEDITEGAGLLYRHNTFAGTFSDLDNDGDADLAVAYDTGAARIYRNDGSLRFSLVAGIPWENKYGYPMGIGIGDINNDTLPDVFFSNVGSSLPEFLLRGDLRKDQELLKDWTLYQNQGDMNFTDVTNMLALPEHEFAWGGVLADIDQNGREDLIVSENYVKIPQQRIRPLPGRVFFQDREGNFIPQEKALKIENPHFSLSSLVSDWNQDSVQDIVWVNIDGFSQLYLSSISNERNVDRIKVPYEARFLGSRWEVKWGNGESIHWRYDPSEGIGSSQSSIWSFLSRAEKPVTVTVQFIGGKAADGKEWYQSGDN